ncbi:hypothetical protein [Streptomyces venezuelae]|uniref:hypothetical protein n=1 Tax=Streptomyces venezuelae TaxID=54571 RepID=UPI0036513D01
MSRLPVAGAVWALSAGALALSSALLVPTRGDSDSDADIDTDTDSAAAKATVAEGEPVGDGTTGRTEISFACSADPTHVVTATVTVLAPTSTTPTSTTPKPSTPRGAVEAGK